MRLAHGLVGRARRPRRGESHQLVGDQKMGQHSDHFCHEFPGVRVTTANIQPSDGFRHLLTLSRPLVSSVVAPAAELISAHFHTSSTTFPTFVLSIFVLGFAFGPLLLAPLSELYGRVIVYHATNVLFVVFTVLCALSQNEAMLLSFRFLSGFAGVATISIGPASIADMMPREKRGKAVSLWAVGTVVGPMIGPVIGGYVAEVLGWRWIFWVISITVSWRQLLNSSKSSWRR